MTFVLYTIRNGTGSRESEVMYLHYFRDGSLRFCNLYFIQIEIKTSFAAHPFRRELFTMTTKQIHNETLNKMTKSTKYLANDHFTTGVCNANDSPPQWR